MLLVCFQESEWWGRQAGSRWGERGRAVGRTERFANQIVLLQLQKSEIHDGNSKGDRLFSTLLSKNFLPTLNRN